MMTALEVTKKKHIFLKLKSSSSSVAYEGLLEIRSNIMKAKDGFKVLRENNILNELVSFLHKPNEKILDVTLSILGNCCLDSDCRNEVVSYGIVNPLASVIHNISRDSIQCRACRLIGNLAQELSFAEQLHNENVTASIVALLDTDSGSSTATRQMAVRALRMLWNVTSQREKMLNCRVVHAVALLLPVNQENIREQHLLLAVVKALAAFTSHCSEECAQQVQGSGSGFQHLIALVTNPSLKYLALECICNLCFTTSLRPALGNIGTVKIIIRELSCHQQDSAGLHTEMVLALCNLCRESVNRAKIRRAGGLLLMLRIIRDSSIASLRSSVLNALVQFMYDEASLQELLREGLVGTLVHKITEFVKENGKAHSKSSVRLKTQKDSIKDNSCDDNVDIASSSSSRHLPPVLRSSCTSSGLNHRDREPQPLRRRFRANSPSYQAVVQEQVHTTRCMTDVVCLEHCREPSPDYCMAGDWSPGSPNSMCFSPDGSPLQRGIQTASPSLGSTSDGFSPPSSPPPLYSEVFDDVDYPEAYSPICYDPGEDEDSRENEHEDDVEEDEEASTVSWDTSEDKNSEHVALSPDSKQSVSGGRHLCDGELDAALILLSRVSHMDSPVEELAAHSTFAALIAYITLIRDPHPRASRTLFRIIRNHHYFMSLLLHRFVPTVQSRLCQPQHSACGLCSEFKSTGLSLLSQITMLAHSGFGEGELAHHLLKGEESVQRLLAVSVPYIVRIQRILWKLLVECNALKTLVHVLGDTSTGDDGLRKYVPVSLTLVAGALNVPNPCHRTKGTYDHDDNYPDSVDERDFGRIVMPSGTEASGDVIFLLLDDSTSIQVSKMQLSLQSPVFEAMFRGSFRESKEDFVALPGISRACLISLLHILKLGGVLSCVPDIDLTTSLELVAVLDRFLVPGSEQLTEMIVSKFLSHSTAVDIYIRCMEVGDVSHFHTLRYDTVRFILTSNIAPSKTEKIFQDLMQCPYRKQVLTDITDILQGMLNQIPGKPPRLTLLKKST